MSSPKCSVQVPSAGLVKCGMVRRSLCQRGEPDDIMDLLR